MAYGDTVGQAGAILANADAQRAQQFYNVLSQLYQNQQFNRGLGARMQESEAERAAKFFDIGQRREMSQKQLEAQAEALNKEIEAKKNLAQMEIDAAAKLEKERLAANLDVAKLQYSPTRVPERVAIENLKAEQEAKTLNALATTAANRANQLYSQAVREFSDTMKAENIKAASLVDATPTGPPNERSSATRTMLSAWRNKDLPVRLLKARTDAEKKLKAAIIDIPRQIAESGGQGDLITFDPVAQVFVPVVAGARPMVPGSLPSQASEERFDSEAGLRSDQGLGLSRPSPGSSSLAQRKLDRAVTLRRLNPNASRGEILRQVEQELGQ